MSSGFDWMIYGATGYTGKLIAEQAIAEGRRPVLAGRNAESVRPLAERLGVPWRAFALSDAPNGLKGMKVVLNCAGPFSQTATPMVDACLGLGIHYLDITGEIPVFEAVQKLHQKAVKAGSTLIPGVGFDVVPTDCLAALLHARLPSATTLELAFASAGGASVGTLKTAVEALPGGGRIRKDGKIVEVPLAHASKTVAFSHRALNVTAIPWGDVSTAFHSTGIPNITVYTAMPSNTARGLRIVARLAPIFRLSLVQNALKRFVEKKVTGPTAEQRLRGKSYLWGKVTAPDGKTVEATLDVPEGYRFTVISALECVDRVRAGKTKAGAWTPSKAFGADFVELLPETKLSWHAPAA